MCSLTGLIRFREMMSVRVGTPDASFWCATSSEDSTPLDNCLYPCAHALLGSSKTGDVCSLCENTQKHSRTRLWCGLSVRHVFSIVDAVSVGSALIVRLAESRNLPSIMANTTKFTASKTSMLHYKPFAHNHTGASPHSDSCTQATGWSRRAQQRENTDCCGSHTLAYHA